MQHLTLTRVPFPLIFQPPQPNTTVITKKTKTITEANKKKKFIKGRTKCKSWGWPRFIKTKQEEKGINKLTQVHSLKNRIVWSEPIGGFKRHNMVQQFVNMRSGVLILTQPLITLWCTGQDRALYHCLWMSHSADSSWVLIMYKGLDRVCISW